MANRSLHPDERNFFGLPIKPETIFSDHKNVYKKRIEKRQKKLMKKISFIPNFLNTDEEILLITTGCSPASIIEQFLTGWVIYYLKRSLFVFTNKRIFHIPTKMDYSYRNSIAQIFYADCKMVQIKGRTLLVEYKHSGKEKFLYIGGKEKKKLKSLIPSLSFEGSSGKAQQRIHLCPRCTRELDEGKHTCTNCHLEFKNKDDARKISIIYPGGGYFYARHPFLGMGDAIVETLLLIMVILSIFDVVNGIAGSGANLFLFAIFLVVEKLITIYHSNHFIKEYIPKEKEVKPLSGQPDVQQYSG